MAQDPQAQAIRKRKATKKLEKYHAAKAEAPKKAAKKTAKKKD